MNKKEILQRVGNVIYYRKSTVVEEAVEIRKFAAGLPDEYRTPRRVKECFMPQFLGRCTESRLSSYFAVLAILELSKVTPSLLRAVRLTTLAEECNHEEIQWYFAERSRQRNIASRPRRRDRQVDEEIANFYKRRDYENLEHGLKKAVVAELAEHLEKSPSTIYRAFHNLRKSAVK